MTKETISSSLQDKAIREMAEWQLKQSRERRRLVIGITILAFIGVLSCGGVCHFINNILR